MPHVNDPYLWVTKNGIDDLYACISLPYYDNVTKYTSRKHVGVLPLEWRSFRNNSPQFKCVSSYKYKMICKIDLESS